MKFIERNIIYAVNEKKNSISLFGQCHLITHCGKRNEPLHSRIQGGKRGNQVSIKWNVAYSIKNKLEAVNHIERLHRQQRPYTFLIIQQLSGDKNDLCMLMSNKSGIMLTPLYIQRCRDLYIRMSRSLIYANNRPLQKSFEGSSRHIRGASTARIYGFIDSRCCWLLFIYILYNIDGMIGMTCKGSSTPLLAQSVCIYQQWPLLAAPYEDLKEQ